MKAIRIHGYGATDVLRYEEAPMPALNPDDVLIRVHAAGVNPADWKFRAGWYAEYAPRSLPFILGWDVAGTVEEVGAAARGFKKGDLVFAMADMARNGAYAEYIAVRADEVAMAPASISLAAASGVPLAALTAWMALFDAGDLRAGQTVLIHAAAGGVGGFAVQLAKRAGATVIATASAPNVNYVRALGADQVIDYRSEDFSGLVQDVDMVLDSMGGATQEKSWGVLRKGGILACLALPLDEAAAARHQVRAVPVFVVPNGARLASIAGLIDTGALKVGPAREFALDQVAAAHAASETGSGRGKIILRVAD